MIGLAALPHGAQAIEKALPPLQPPHGEIPPTFWELHHWPILIAAAGFLLAMALSIAWFSRPRPGVSEDPGVVARRALALLRGHPEDGAAVARVSVILRNYVRAVYALAPGELTTTELCQKLKSGSGDNPELAESIGEFLRQCDRWKFDLPSPPPRPGAVERATALVEQIEAGRHTNPAVTP